MVKPEEPKMRLQLALPHADAHGRYEIATLPAVAGADAPQRVFEEGFEEGLIRWHPATGIIARRDNAGHSGACLLLEGKPQEATWNYVSFPLPQKLTAGARYRLSCWMKVDAITPDAPAPYLKIGLTDASGKWLTNVSTNPYDLKKLGTWQQLTAWVETTPETAGGEIAVEKGSLEARPQITLRLDEVALELTESP